MSNPLENPIEYVANGQCHCNNVRFGFRGIVFACYTCHCTDCQIASGTAFTWNLIIKKTDLFVTHGNVETRSYSHQDRELNVHCCQTCGSYLWLHFSDSVEYCSVQVGTLKERQKFKPVAHIWTRSALDWATPNSIAKCFATEPTIEELVRLWRKTEYQNEKQSD